MFRPWLSACAIACGVALVGSLSSAALADLATVTFAESCPPGTDHPEVTAIGLRAGAAPAPDRVNVLVLIDTSASQSGLHRERAAQALDGLLREARTTDRFSVAAVDVACKSLADGFHPASSDTLKRARLALDARTPLGSTDLIACLEAAVEKFQAGDAPRAIVYIGDGPGLSGIDPGEFARLIDLLRAEKVSVSSLGIGPQINWPCLAALASATGGMFVAPEQNDDAAAAGSKIFSLATQAVVWPEGLSIASDKADAALRMLPVAARS